MGAGLGMALALWLLQSNSHRLYDVTAASGAPRLMQTIFVAGLMMYFAFGAALTAFLLIVAEKP